MDERDIDASSAVGAFVERARVTKPRWTMFASGRIYRPVMKIMHRLGWCYPEPVAVEQGFVWCHWCGMRGRALARHEETSRCE